jgi:hypothetical protein
MVSDPADALRVRDQRPRIQRTTVRVLPGWSGWPGPAQQPGAVCWPDVPAVAAQPVVAARALTLNLPCLAGRPGPCQARRLTCQAQGRPRPAMADPASPAAHAARGLRASTGRRGIRSARSGVRSRPAGGWRFRAGLSLPGVAEHAGRAVLATVRGRVRGAGEGARLEPPQRRSAARRQRTTAGGQLRGVGSRQPAAVGGATLGSSSGGQGSAPRLAGWPNCGDQGVGPGWHGGRERLAAGRAVMAGPGQSPGERRGAAHSPPGAAPVQEHGFVGGAAERRSRCLGERAGPAVRGRPRGPGRAWTAA